MKMNANKALHRTRIPLRPVAAGELGRWQGFGRACGLNPADVARRLGGGHKDEVAVSNWLSGRNEPNMRNLLRLSTALRTDPAELLTDDPGSTIRWGRFPFPFPHKLRVSAPSE